MSKKITYIIIGLFLMVSTHCFSQSQTKIDSLNHLINQSNIDSNKVNLLITLSNQYDAQKSIERINYLIDAITLAKKIQHTYGLKKTYVTLIRILYYREMYDLSFFYCLEALKFYENKGLKDEMFSLYNVYSLLLVEQNKFDEAYKYYLLCKNYHIKKKNHIGIASVLSNMSLLFSRANQLDSAMAYSLKSIQVFKEINNRDGWANSILGVAEIYLKQEDLISAKQKSFEALEIYSSDRPNTHGIATSLVIISQVYLKGNQPDLALRYIKKGLQYADSLNFLSLKRDCYKYIAECYSSLEKHKEAYEARIIYESYNDSISMRLKTGKMLEMEVKYDISKKEKEIQEKEYEIDAANAQKKYLIVGIIGILLLLTVSMRAYNQKKKSNIIITEQKSLVEHKQKEIVDSINYAKRIQKGIMPGEMEFTKIFKNSFILYKPKDIVSGDFYWFVHLRDTSINKNIVVFAAADCTGHGVPGAFMSMLNSALLNQTILNPNIKTPADVLNYINSELPKNLKSTEGEYSLRDGMDIALCIFDFNTNELHFSGANNPCWIIRDNTLMELKATKQAITASDEMSKKVFMSETISLQKDDSIYIFTDGYTDQFGGPKGKKFKHKQFQSLLLSLQADSMESQKHKLNSAFETWIGDLEQVDDVCVIGIKI